MQESSTQAEKLSLLERVALECVDGDFLHFREREQSEEAAITRALQLKRIMDITFVVMAMPFLVPLFLLLAAAIKLDSKGSVFFKQTRTGLNGLPFQIYKFRSMTECAGKCDKAVQSRKDDLRHTRMGRFLRATSMDELPQLINVLRGEMSLIGPRPHALYHDKAFARLSFGYAERFRMRPGLTGWAQVHGSRGFIETQEEIQDRTNYDNDYIEGWTLARDIGILFKTVLVVFKGTNAH